MGSNIEIVTQMDTLTSDISSSFTVNLEDGHVLFFIKIKESVLIDGSDSENLLDSGDERGSLEDGSLESLEGSFELRAAFNCVMQFYYGHVLFTSALLGLHEPSGSIQADDEASSNLRVESS